MYTYDETGVFFLGFPPVAGFLLDFNGELDPVTERSGEKVTCYGYNLFSIIMFLSKTFTDGKTYTN